MRRAESVQPRGIHMSVDAREQTETIASSLLQMDPLLFQAAEGLPFVPHMQGGRPLEGPCPDQMPDRRLSERLPGMFFVPAVPGGQIFVVVVRVDPEPAPRRALVRRDIAERAVEDHLAPHPADLPSEAGLHEIAEDVAAYRPCRPLVPDPDLCHVLTVLLVLLCADIIAFSAGKSQDGRMKTGEDPLPSPPFLFTLSSMNFRNINKND